MNNNSRVDYEKRVMKWDFLRLFQAERYHGYVVAEAALVAERVVQLHRAVELGQLFLEQLQVGIDEAQLERHRFSQLFIARRPAQTTITLAYTTHTFNINTNNSNKHNSNQKHLTAFISMWPTFF